MEMDTLVYGFTWLQSIYDLYDKMIEITPIEENHPICIFKDKTVEEINFLTLFFGKGWYIDIIK